MRRSALALGASVIALALTAGSAAADPVTGQTVSDTTGSAQVGAVAVDAPVRVASDGDSATTGAGAGGPQTTGDSVGSAQVTSVDANAPVRALSDGNDTEGAGSAGAGTQSTGDSNASAQVGAVDLDAPVRVASDGDNSSDAGPGSAGPQQSADDSNGSAQVGSPTVFAPARILSGGTGPGDEPGEPDVGDVAGDLLGTLLANPPKGGGEDLVASPSEVAPAPRGGGSPSPDELSRLVDGADPDPAIQFASGGNGDSFSAGEVQTLGVSASSLPLTGLGLVASAAMGLWMFSAGLALRLVPGGRRR